MGDEEFSEEFPTDIKEFLAQARRHNKHLSKQEAIQQLKELYGSAKTYKKRSKEELATLAKRLYG